jgi:hypothetical protein
MTETANDKIRKVIEITPYWHYRSTAMSARSVRHRYEPASRDRHPVFSRLDIFHRELAGGIGRGVVTWGWCVQVGLDIGAVHYDGCLFQRRSRGRIENAPFHGAKAVAM